VSATFEEQWQRWLVETNRRGVRTTILIVLLLEPVFGLLDHLIAPREQLFFLLGTRAVVMLASVAMLQVVRSELFARHVNLLSAAYSVLVASSISAMTIVLGGLASPYYAGLCLVIIGTGFLHVWPTRVLVLMDVAIIATFVVPNLVVGGLHAPVQSIVGNLVFLISTAGCRDIGLTLTWSSQRDQLLNRVRLEETKASLESAHEQLKALDSFKSQLFANITHEFKTPLAMLLAPLELILHGDMGELTNAQETTFRSMFRNGLKLLKMIGDLLDLSKLEESKLRLKVAEHDLVEYLRGLVAQVQPLALRKGIDLVFATDVASCGAWCDLERVERVFLNLLSNATKFTAPGGHIHVRLRDLGKTVQVMVEDDGPGFPPEKAQQIFERFYQVDMGGTRRYGGTGIGLALAKEICELHGGRIWAESNDGARFTVELFTGRDHFKPEVLERRGLQRDMPSGARAADRGLMDFAVQMAARDDFRLLDITEATERRVVERDADEDQRSHVVLVIDDNADILRLVNMALRTHFKVLALSDGHKGLEIAAREQPSLIVTDLMMPEIDGLEITRRLRADEKTRHIPVLMLTARGDLEDKLAGLETGVNAYLAKPFSPRELLSTARSLVSSQSATADLLLTQRMDSLEIVAGGLAHEINNPLNYLKNALARIRIDAQLIAEGKAGAELPKLAARMGELFDIAESGIRRITGTVELMSSYSRAGFSRQLRGQDAFAAARDVVALVLPATGQTVRVETEFEGDGTIECVPEEFNQILTNLIQNAIEACPSEGGVVRIRGVRAGPKLTLTVKDNGPGIKAEDLARIFTPFFTTKGPGRGMGLGLTIAWRVVQSLGGTIEAKPGPGAEFVLTVPASQQNRLLVA
jgi:signal transduction histidine kinase